MKSRLAPVLATALLVGAIVPAGSSARSYCHGMPVGHTGDVYLVSGVSCHTAKRVGLRFLRKQHLLPSWRCSGRRSNSGRSAYVFSCRGSHGRTLRVYDAAFAD